MSIHYWYNLIQTIFRPIYNFITDKRFLEKNKEKLNVFDNLDCDYISMTFLNKEECLLNNIEFNFYEIMFSPQKRESVIYDLPKLE